LGWLEHCHAVPRSAIAAQTLDFVVLKIPKYLPTLQIAPEVALNSTTSVSSIRYIPGKIGFATPFLNLPTIISRHLNQQLRKARAILTIRKTFLSTRLQRGSAGKELFGKRSKEDWT